MSCAPYDPRDYYFDELGDAERREFREHLSRCERCSGELERLSVAALSLSALPQEEIPRRIAFVSDRVFEPSPMARWWRAFWLPGSRVVATSAALLAGAIFFHAYHQPPAGAGQVVSGQPVRVEAAKLDRAVLSRTEIQSAVDEAVAKAVAATEARYDAKLRAAAMENQVQIRDYMERTQETLSEMERHSRVLTVASNRLPESGQ